MKRYVSNTQLRLIQWTGAIAATVITYTLALSLACGTQPKFSTTSLIFFEDGLRFSLMFLGFTMLTYIMSADLIEYFLWRHGARDNFVPVKRNPWNGFIEKTPEKITLDEYKAGIQVQLVFGIPLGLAFCFFCFRYYTPSFCQPS